MILLLFNSIDDVVFHFVKARFELAEAFIEDTCHTNQHIADLLRHSSTERRFKLRFHCFDDGFCVPLALLIQIYESILEFQYFSDNYFHFILGLFTLALNNVVFSEYLDEIIMHVNNCLS